MNEYNHHKIVRKFVSKIDKKYLHGILLRDFEDVFVKASDFTDSCEPKEQNNYFLYHFYYDIRVADGKIKLSRVDESQHNYAESMRHCGEYNGKEYKMSFSPKTGKKDFFSIINDRPKPAKVSTEQLIENQSDNVAFLHAMGTDSEDLKKSRSLFERHLKKCFAEYLFVKDEKKALFMLGIAFHGIMDSFTPSHMDFQHYSKQDMALHAQGDVIPIHEVTKVLEVLEFVPGQIDKDENWVSRLLSTEVKWLNDNDYMNATEYAMLKIFLYISKLRRKDGTRSVNVEKLWEKLGNKRLSEIREELKGYIYGNDAYVYSDTALVAMCRIYRSLSDARKNLDNPPYQEYKKAKDGKNKNGKSKVDEALEIWKSLYDSDKMRNIRNSHLGLQLYKKDPSISRFLHPIDAYCDTDDPNRTAYCDIMNDGLDTVASMYQKLSGSH